MKNLYKFFIAHAHGFCYMDASERYLARSMFSTEATADSQLHHSAAEFLRSHTGCINFSEPQKEIEKAASRKLDELERCHEDAAQAICDKYEPLFRAAYDKVPRGQTVFDDPAVEKLARDKGNELRDALNAYEHDRDAVEDKCEADKKEWKCYKAEDVDAFIKKCQAYNKEKKKDGLMFYCTIDRKKDSSGFPYVDMGYCKCQVED